ncbi:hypothetical protein HYPSUDRAFT_32093 [Hypholoma sublateritium FD-334 SS-4]|uniref:GST N-terminal domain-containing protein n=1 Tax=Hypholoma sublateritium (strain FD-334 SS-4) TaxID=945553 RepID=A0A0D2QEL5_HYPSF|nr:hypothetical protein HYPSUDRAFT_32093 [Hypholoma sublateritium FD-334 SS-4]
MSSEAPAVILYRYDTSPFTHKVDNVLALKNVPYQRVQVSPLLPRPEITEYLGINYRRIPILAIGNDVYCDTSIITAALERRFPPSQGYGTIFPKGKHSGKADTGMIKAFAKSYAEAVLFAPAVTMIPWQALPEAFIKDRSALVGGPIDPQAMVARRPAAESILTTNMALIEEQLSDGRDWLFDTELPGLADISVHFILAWARGFPGTEALFDKSKNPHVIQWLDRLSKFFKEHASQNISIVIKGEDAANKIISSTHESYDFVGFDEREASRLGVSAGDTVQIAPEDTGRNYPTTGTLVALNREEFILEVSAPQGLVRVHFPRVGFTVKADKSPKL